MYNGNGYDEGWPDEANRRGIWRLDSAVEAMCLLDSPKNVALFGAQNVFKAEELSARKEILLDHYTGTVEMEALCMVDMINQVGVASSVYQRGTTCGEEALFFVLSFFK